MSDLEISVSGRDATQVTIQVDQESLNILLDTPWLGIVGKSNLAMEKRWNILQLQVASEANPTRYNRCLSVLLWLPGSPC